MPKIGVSQNFLGVAYYPILVPHVPDLKNGSSVVLVVYICDGIFHVPDLVEKMVARTWVLNFN